MRSVSTVGGDLAVFAEGRKHKSLLLSTRIFEPYREKNMNEKKSQSGNGKSRSEIEREERLRTALRANLQRRKAQTRARKTDDGAKEDE